MQVISPIVSTSCKAVQERDALFPKRLSKHLIASFAASAALLTATACDSPSKPELDNLPSRIVWRVDGRGLSTAPVYDAENVFFGGESHEFLAVNKSNGAVIWRQFTDAGPFTLGNSIVRAGPNLVVVDFDIFAFDAESGTLAWTFDSLDLVGPGAGSLVADSSSVYSTASRATVFAIDASSGALKWKTRLPGDSVIGAFGAVVRDGVVYVGIARLAATLGGGLAAIDASDGNVLWMTDFNAAAPGESSVCLGDAEVTADKVIVTTSDGRVHALNRANGAVLWTAPGLGQTSSTFPTDVNRTAIVVGSTVVVGSTAGIVVGLDVSTGGDRWRQLVGAEGVAFKPSTDGKLAYMVIPFGEIMAIDAETGEIAWRTGPKQSSSVGQFFQPSADSNYVYASSTRGFFALSKE